MKVEVVTSQPRKIIMWFVDEIDTDMAIAVVMSKREWGKDSPFKRAEVYYTRKMREFIRGL